MFSLFVILLVDKMSVRIVKAIRDTDKVVNANVLSTDFIALFRLHDDALTEGTHLDNLPRFGGVVLNIKVGVVGGYLNHGIVEPILFGGVRLFVRIVMDVHCKVNETNLIMDVVNEMMFFLALLIMSFA